MIFDYNNKEIQIKMIFYGPAMSGKTTSIRNLFNYFNKINSVKSIENSLGRTLVFDFGVLKFEGNDWTLKFLIYSATGQDFYASTRTATLKGADGIIFVIDSYYNCLNRNKHSWKELKEFFKEKIFHIPILIAFNKNDLDNSKKFTKEEFISEDELKNFNKIYFIKTSAINGVGIIESFQMIINSIFPNIILKV
ncbi:MAG: GTPase domain-containing protein [Candidatus Lokiarchaeota archaeon]|nr:GTPase domain-containing protein [Candidatus Lokiarchaeota archaeon]